MGKVPGSCCERLVAFTWYGVVVTLWLGLISFLTEFFYKVKRPDYEGLPKRSGQTVVITGGSRGIGLEVLRRLLQLDYHVVLGVRNPYAGYKAVESIRRDGVHRGSVQCLKLDLMSLDSVRRFANDVIQQTEKINVLINNAGVMFEPYSLTGDNFETQFQVNYLSHFLLTQLLLPKLKATGGKGKEKCRIVNISSLAHLGSQTRNVEEMARPTIYSSYRSYYDSKFCQVLFTKYLAAQLKSEGANVGVYVLHPGVIPTGLYVNLKIFGTICHMFKAFFRTTEEGAEMVLYAVLSPSLSEQSGCYIANQSVKTASSLADDLSLQKQLWDFSQEACREKQQGR